MEKIEELLKKYNCYLEGEATIMHNSGKRIAVNLNENFIIPETNSMSIEEKLLYSLEQCLKKEVGVIENG